MVHYVYIRNFIHIMMDKHSFPKYIWYVYLFFFFFWGGGGVGWTNLRVFHLCDDPVDMHQNATLHPYLHVLASGTLNIEFLTLDPTPCYVQCTNPCSFKSDTLYM